MQMFWYGCVCAYTPLALWGKVSFRINSLSQQGYVRDQLSCSSCALNFNNSPNSEAQHQGVPKLYWPVDKNQLVTTWNPTGLSWYSRQAQPTIQPERSQRFWKLGKFCCKTHTTFSLVTKLCTFPVHVSGSWSRDLLSSRLPCDPRCVWAHGAMAWCLLPLLSVCLTEGGWVGTGAAPGQPREEAEEGLCWPELLAKGIYLWLTTGTAELHNCSLPRVQGAASRQGQESFCDYFCSCRARFSPCSLKDFSHFSDSFPVRFFF